MTDRIFNLLAQNPILPIKSRTHRITRGKRSTYFRNYYLQNKEKISARSKKRYAADKKRHLKRNAKYRARPEIAERIKARRKSSQYLAEQRVRDKRRYDANKEAINAKRRENYAKRKAC